MYIDLNPSFLYKSVMCGESTVGYKLHGLVILMIFGATSLVRKEKVKGRNNKGLTYAISVFASILTT